MVLTSNPEPSGDLIEWFADVYASTANALTTGAGRCWVGGCMPCPREPDDPPVCPREWARMDLILDGTRRTILSRAGRRIETVCVPGDVCYWAPGAWAAEAQDHVRYVGVVLRKAYLRSILVTMTPAGGKPSHVHHTASPLGGAAEGVGRALDVLAAERDGEPSTERNLCAAMLCLANRHLLARQEVPCGAEATWLRLRDFLVDFAHWPLLREDVAKALRLSPGYVSELCRAHAGETFRQVLERIRLERACRLLRVQRELTVAEIAYRCGYKDPSYFGRAFRRLIGSTPGAFRLG